VSGGVNLGWCSIVLWVDMPRARPDPDFDMAFPVLYRRAVQDGSRMLKDSAGAEDVAAEALARAYAR
jgi:DNA-directed RNA polymerase specialized sigma24 family protein